MTSLKYTVYRTTNLINQKFYIGFHQTNDPYDDYLGSGKYLKHAIAKHGIENFKKDVLFIFETAQEAFTKERELIAEHLGHHLCMNITEGGKGGFQYYRDSGMMQTEMWRKIAQKAGIKGMAVLKEKMKTDEVYRKNFLEKIKLGQKKAMMEGRFDNRTFLGKKHTNETKIRIGKKNSVHQMGEGNSQYGSFWITNGTINKKCRGDIPEGFWKGRKC